MINRIIIRIKVLQIVYAYYAKSSMSLESAEKELMRSLQHAYDLYHYFLFLIVILTDAEQKRLDMLKYKYLPTENELAPDTRFINNRFVKQIQDNKILEKFINTYGTIWNNNDDNPNLIKNLLNKIKMSDSHKEYINSEDCYDSDKNFWCKVFKKNILNDKDVIEVINNNSIYINEEIELVGTFVLKTMKRFNSESGPYTELMPMFKNDEDRLYAINLLRRTLLEKEEHHERINRHIKNWELERIALIDLFIMQIAMAEIKNFPSIPTNVTLNEYIDLARYYSTPKSAHFINGILDVIVNEYKNEGLLFKN
jgi:N utilization substance protein B